MGCVVMEATEPNKMASALKQEIMLQVNERLYAAGLIPQSMYTFAKDKIIQGT